MSIAQKDFECQDCGMDTTVLGAGVNLQQLPCDECGGTMKPVEYKSDTNDNEGGAESE